MSNPLQPLNDYLNELVSKETLPGGVIGLAHRGMPVFTIPFGYSATLPEKIVAKANTIYDAASLTKPLITTTLILQFVQRDMLSLESSLASFYPSCPPNKTNITVSDLLCHSSGIMDWYPLYAVANDLSGYVEKILELPLESPRGTKATYSCLNFILLADIIRKTTGDPFIQIAKELILEPLKLERSFLGKSSEFQRDEIAATECNSDTETKKIKEFSLYHSFRTGLIWGETHDCNSYSAGGSAGNSGLFTTVEEAFTLSEQYTDRSQLLNEGIRAKVGSNETSFGPQHRTLGWQLASSPESSAGDALSPLSIGHTGFTGTSLWYDPEEDLTYIILSNHVHPKARNIDMNEVRRNIHERLKVAFLEMS